MISAGKVAQGTKPLSAETSICRSRAMAGNSAASCSRRSLARLDLSPQPVFSVTMIFLVLVPSFGCAGHSKCFDIYSLNWAVVVVGAIPVHCVFIAQDFHRRVVAIHSPHLRELCCGV